MNRWIRLSAAVFVMILIGNLQYAWTLFVKPLTTATGWSLSEVQWGFTFFIALGTWAMPVSGVLIDRAGPRAFIAFSGLLCGLGGVFWGVFAKSARVLYSLLRRWHRSRVRLLRSALDRAQMVSRQTRTRRLRLVTAFYYCLGAALFNPLFAASDFCRGYRAIFLWLLPRDRSRCIHYPWADCFCRMHLSEPCP